MTQNCSRQQELLKREQLFLKRHLIGAFDSQRITNSERILAEEHNVSPEWMVKLEEQLLEINTEIESVKKQLKLCKKSLAFASIRFNEVHFYFFI